MTINRLENLRVIDGLLTVYQTRLSALEDTPKNVRTRTMYKMTIKALTEERDLVYGWIETIPDTFIANAIILRYVKQATWKEIGKYLNDSGGGAAVKRKCLKYVWYSDGGLHNTSGMKPIIAESVNMYAGGIE